MTGSVIFSEDAAPIEWSETEPFKLEFGPKAATFAALPKEWTPPFALISASVITGSKQDGLARHVLGENIVSRIRELAKNTGRIYIRSSIIGETIWDRGSYDSVIVDLVSKDFKAALNIPLPWGKEASEQQAATTARRSGDRTRCTAPGPRPRTEAAPA
jgi:hypothetical protein